MRDQRHAAVDGGGKNAECDVTEVAEDYLHAGVADGLAKRAAFSSDRSVEIALDCVAESKQPARGTLGGLGGVREDACWDAREGTPVRGCTFPAHNGGRDVLESFDLAIDPDLTRDAELPTDDQYLRRDGCARRSGREERRGN
jgi:hypothetical protein